jgi:hypothetical protein
MLGRFVILKRSGEKWLKDFGAKTGNGVKLDFNYPELRLSWNATLKKTSTR